MCKEMRNIRIYMLYNILLAVTWTNKKAPPLRGKDYNLIDVTKNISKALLWLHCHQRGQARSP